MDRPYVVGIDIGGQSAKIGIVDTRGTVLSQTAIKSNDTNSHVEFIDNLCSAVEKLAEKANIPMSKIRGIGIGAPNANYYTGTIENAVNLTFGGMKVIPFADLMSERIGLPVRLTNDANAAAVGEMTYGAARGMKNFITITLGTGVGSGIVVGGYVLYGHDGFAGEYGHIMVDSRVTGRECGCGRRGCLEAYASATGIKRTAFELMAKMNCDSELRDTPFSKFEAVMLSIAADKGDPIAKEAFRYTGEVLGKALADLVATTSPKAIILFGGLAKAGKYIFEPTKWYMEENMLPTFKNKVQLLPSGIEGKNAAILGSSALIWQKQQK